MDKISNCETLTQKCILARAYLSPQSTHIETIIKNDLLLSKPVNETSGDGCKNGVNYEIKTSVHAKNSKANWVQIRPDHDIHYYILIAYNMYFDNDFGKSYIFKVPSDDMYKLIVKYGGYAHGTVKNLGKITHENLKGRNCEYALRCEMNICNGKNFDLWNELLKYETQYKAMYF